MKFTTNAAARLSDREGPPLCRIRPLLRLALACGAAIAGVHFFGGSPASL